MGKKRLQIKKPKPKRRRWIKGRMPKPGEDEYYKFKYPPKCGYEKKYRYNMSLGTYGVPAELLHWCLKNCKCLWGWWFKNDNGWYRDWNYETNEAYMSFNSKREAFRFWFEIGHKHYGDNDPDEH